MKNNKRIAWFTVFIATVFLAACDNQSGHMGSQRIPSSFSSNGEQIYFTGVSKRNSEIQYDGGGHMQMMGGGACASCHGADRRGGIRMMPYFWVKAPPLLAESLFGDHDEGGNGHDDHDNYNEISIRKVISTGFDPSGEPLDDLMPRWRMTDEDMSDLIAFLKS
jgi:cytochrome c oxidase subunit 2